VPIDDPLTTDEALARRAGADFPLLLDPDQVYASGSDGAFASPASFDLTSASNAFAAQGVPVGAAVLVEREPAEADDRAESLWFAAVVTNPALTLRRKGLVPGAGVPPGRELGTTGVSFRVLSLEPQVRAASAALRARYRLDPADPYSPAASGPGPTTADVTPAFGSPSLRAAEIASHESSVPLTLIFEEFGHRPANCLDDPLDGQDARVNRLPGDDPVDLLALHPGGLGRGVGVEALLLQQGLQSIG
jgi:hypothetical protein